MENLEEGQQIQDWKNLSDNQKNEISAIVKNKLLNIGHITGEIAIQVISGILTELQPGVVLYKPDKIERALRLTKMSW